MSRQFFELTQRKGWLKSVDVVLPKSWDLEKCFLTDKTVAQRRIPTREMTDIIIHGTKKFSLNSYACFLYVHLL